MAVCAALLTLFLMPVTFAEPASAAPAVKPGACGSEKFRKANGTLYTCSFADDFSGTKLNPAHWMVQTSAGPSGFSPGHTCYVNSSNNVFVRDGYLNLVARINPAFSRCKTPYKLFHTRYHGGAVVSFDRFSQTYGRFSFRARFPGTTLPGYWGNLWLYPQTMTYGGFPASGEIDVAEQWSGHPDMVHPSLHYPGRTRADTAWNCQVPNVGAFHTYTLEWTPTLMKFFYDGRLCFERTWKPLARPRDGRPFNHPFGLVMSQGFGDPYFPVSRKLPTAASMKVDWVRVWR
jgi:beta-glucanase (GH16 family)